jgi:hypothetical protein
VRIGISRQTRLSLYARRTSATMRCHVRGILIIVVAPLCVALLVLFGAQWVALHFGVGHEATIEPPRRS